MAKEKKITITYFPRKSKKTGEFSVYCRITYDRKSTMIATSVPLVAKNMVEAKKELKKLETKSKDKVPFTVLSDLTHSIIRYEIKKSKERFSIIGFSEKLERYREGLGFFLHRILLKKLLVELEDILSYKRFTQLIDFINTNDSYTVLIFLESIEYLEKALKFKISKQVKENLFELAFSCYTINFFLFNIWNDVDGIIEDLLTKGGHELPSTKEKNERKKILTQHIPISIWMINQPIGFHNRKIKDEFKNFLNEMSINKLNSYTDNNFCKIFPPDEFSYKTDYETIILINSELEKYINSEG